MHWAKRILLFPVRAVFYFLVFVHEAGHFGAGLMLGYPVQGIEIGPFPHRVINSGKFRLQVGKFPRGGRTLLGFSNKSFSRWQQFCFLSAGILLELAFFLFLFYLGRRKWWAETLILLFYLDQLGVNLYPKFENGKPANDGALILEWLFPQKALKIKLSAKQQ